MARMGKRQMHTDVWQENLKVETTRKKKCEWQDNNQINLK